MSTSERNLIIGSLSRQSVEDLVTKIFTAPSSNARNTDRDRALKLAALLSPENRIRRDVVLTALFPEQALEQAQTNLRAYRSRITKIALSKANVRFELIDDRETNKANTERWCHFEGPEAALMNAEKQAGTAMYRDEDRFEGQGAIALNSDGKPKQKIRLFVSFAHADELEVSKFLKVLSPLLRSASEFDFEIWKDEKLEVGEVWNSEILNRIELCDYGLLLLSPEFFASEYITTQELPKFIDSNQTHSNLKPAAPVSLKYVPLDGTIDTRGVVERQIFFCSKNQSFANFQTESDRASFASEFFQKLTQSLVRLTKKTGNTDENTALLKLSVSAEQYIDSPETQYTAQDATQSQFSNYQIGTDSGSRFKPKPELAIDLLLQWACDPKQSPYMALLAELGMGKTTTCRELKSRLLKRRRNDNLVPVPIYLDLRWVVALAKSTSTDHSALNELLDPTKLFELLLKQSQNGADSPLTVTELKKLLAANQLILMIDSLDEVLVQLGKTKASSFLGSLYRFLPIDPLSGRPQGKMLIACRTHYFPTMAAQNSALLQQDRGNVRGVDYSALLLLPFTPEQIKAYVRNSVSGATDQKLDDIEQLFANIHNLKELCSRPLNLWLLTELLPELERLKLSKQRISSINIYENLVLRWLGRDDEKHHITAMLKPVLMQHLALALWRSGQRSWHVSQLDQWFVEFKDQNYSFALHLMDKSIELLKEDLRNSTFIVREVESDDFRFAHTSFQEYFLSCALYRTLVSTQSQAQKLDATLIWASPRFNQETFGFLAEKFNLLALDEQSTALDAMRELLTNRNADVQMQVLDYCLLANEHHWPAPSLAGASFSNLELHGWKFYGRLDKPLNLRNTEWLNVNMRETEWHHANVTGARFYDCDAAFSKFDKLLLNKAEFKQTVLQGSDFYRCDLRDIRIQGNENETLANCDLIACEANANVVSDRRSDTISKAAIRIGHGSGILSIAISACNRLIASASSDKTIKIWHSNTGRCAATLVGHISAVTSIAFSPDSNFFASASYDDTIKLWDLNTGHCERTLDIKGHGITSIAFSPDGQEIASATTDGNIKLWNAHTGNYKKTINPSKYPVRCIDYSNAGAFIAIAAGQLIEIWNHHKSQLGATLTGHDSLVQCVTYSPNGKQIGSGSLDNTIKLWEASSGRCETTLRGHDSAILGIAFSADGKQIASASADQTIKLWNTNTERCEGTLWGHLGHVNSIAYMFDGKTLASASMDGSIKLWNTSTRSCNTTLNSNANGSSFLAFVLLPDLKHIATVSEFQTVNHWSLTTGACKTYTGANNSKITCAAISLDGMFFATFANDQTIQVLRIGDPHCESTIKTDSSTITSLAFSPNGMQIASVSNNRSIQLWERASGRCSATMSDKNGGIISITVAPNGTQIAAGCRDGTIKLWDIETGVCTASIQICTRPVTSVAYRRDGLQLASTCLDQTVRLWNLQTNQCQEILKAPSSDQVGISYGSTDEDLILRDGNKVTVFSKQKISRSFYTFGSGSERTYGHCSIDESTGKFIEIDGSAWRYARLHVPSSNTAEGCESPNDLWLVPSKESFNELKT
jgi:WD40 repeat protein